MGGNAAAFDGLVVVIKGEAVDKKKSVFLVGGDLILDGEDSLDRAPAFSRGANENSHVVALDGTGEDFSGGLSLGVDEDDDFFVGDEAV